jgi:hypothetical protein
MALPPRAGNRKIKYLMFADGCYKSLRSLPVPREGRNVHSMDSLTTWELEGSVVYESSTAAYVLGHTIDVIFKSFTQHVQSKLPLNSMELLTVPWASVPAGVRSIVSPTQHSEANWKMYDSNARRWRWSFDIPAAIANQSSSATTTTTTMASPPLGSSHSTPHSPLTSEQLVIHFFNSVALVVRKKAPSLVQDDIKRHWMANWSSKSIPGSSGYNRKPDLVLIDNSALMVDEISWWSPKVLAKYTKESFQPAKYLGKTMDTKAYLTFLEQPWRRFILGLSICNGAELRLHFYDRSGGAVSPVFNIHMHPDRLIYVLCAVAFGGRGCIGFDVTMSIKPIPAWIRGLLSFFTEGSEAPSSQVPLSPKSLSPLFPTANDNLNDNSRSLRAPAIGTILIGDDSYDIIDILFSSPGFLGRGTVCYLARKNNVFIIIKDHWVRLSPHCEVLNEVNIMEWLWGIEGVPKLHSYWAVVADSMEDCTERY